MHFFINKIIISLLLCLCSCTSLEENLVKLKSTDSQDRLEAIQWLHNNVESDTTKKLLEEAVVKDKSPVIRSFALRLMVLTNDKKYLPFVVDALDDEDYIVRMEAAQSIGSLRAFQYKELLGEKLQSESHPWVKLKILKSLRYLRAKQVILPLIKVLDDESPAVRFQALATLERFTKQNFGLQTESWENWYKNSQQKNNKQ